MLVHLTRRVGQRDSLILPDGPFSATGSNVGATSSAKAINDRRNHGILMAINVSGGQCSILLHGIFALHSPHEHLLPTSGMVLQRTDMLALHAQQMHLQHMLPPAGLVSHWHGASHD